MTVQHEVMAGAEAWSYEGHGSCAACGVVVIHGFTGTALAVRPLAEALSRQGFRVTQPRLPGHGTSWRELARMRYADWLAEVERATDDLETHCRVVVPVGLSMGATLALDVGSSGREKVGGVVAINPQLLDRQGVMARLAPLVGRLIPAVPAHLAGLPPDDVARAGVTERGYRWVPIRAAQSLLDELPRVRTQLRELHVPLLVAYSLHDRCVASENSTAIPNLTSAPTELLALERSRHLAPLDYDSELLEKRVVSFVQRVCESEA